MDETFDAASRTSSDGQADIDTAPGAALDKEQDEQNRLRPLFGRSQKARSALAQRFDQAAGRERDYIGELLASRRRAYRFSATMLFGCASAWIAASMAIWYWEPPPVEVIRVDNLTGAVDRVAVSGIDQIEITDAMAESMINTYILNCEGYHWNFVQQWHDVCAIYSSESIQRNDLAPKVKQRLETLGQQTMRDVMIRSIVPGKKQTSVVRFSTRELPISANPATSKVGWTHHVATLTYDLAPGGPKDRFTSRFNPLGFQVITYRVDDETISR